MTLQDLHQLLRAERDRVDASLKAFGIKGSCIILVAEHPEGGISAQRNRYGETAEDASKSVAVALIEVSDIADSFLPFGINIAELANAIDIQERSDAN